MLLLTSLIYLFPTNQVALSGLPLLVYSLSHLPNYMGTVIVLSLGWLPDSGTLFPHIFNRPTLSPLLNLNLKPLSFLLLITVLNPKPALRQVLLCFARDIMTVLRVLMFAFTVLYFENL